jgi:hypothetical protein
MSNPHDQHQDAVEAWKARWPDYCRACGGWGLIDYRDPRTGEAGAEPCRALPEGSCHRCGTPDAIHPEGVVLSRGCIECGWDFDDGIP